MLEALKAHVAYSTRNTTGSRTTYTMRQHVTYIGASLAALVVVSCVAFVLIEWTAGVLATKTRSFPVFDQTLVEASPCTKAKLRLVSARGGEITVGIFNDASVACNDNTIQASQGRALK